MHRHRLQGNLKEAKPLSGILYGSVEKAHRRAPLPHPETIWDPTALVLLIP